MHFEASLSADASATNLSLTRRFLLQMFSDICLWRSLTAMWSNDMQCVSVRFCEHLWAIVSWFCVVPFSSIKFHIIFYCLAMTEARFSQWANAVCAAACTSLAETSLDFQPLSTLFVLVCMILWCFVYSANYVTCILTCWSMSEFLYILRF